MSEEKNIAPWVVEFRFKGDNKVFKETVLALDEDNAMRCLEEKSLGWADWYTKGRVVVTIRAYRTSIYD